MNRRHVVSQMLAFCLTTLAVVPAVAQERLQGKAFAGVVFPTGDFGDELGEDAGLATPGAVLGVALEVPIRRVPGLSWHSTAEGVTFGVEDDFFDDLFGEELEVDLGRYWTAVAHSGARYSVPVNPFLEVYGTAQLSVGMFKAPGATVSVFGETAVLTTEWSPARGYALGGGLSFHDRVDLDARYKRLINPEIKGELRYDGEVEDFTADQNVSWLQVTIGIRWR
jgi:opacity protein-like surface antigen